MSDHSWMAAHEHLSKEYDKVKEKLDAIRTMVAGYDPRHGDILVGLRSILKD